MTDQIWWFATRGAGLMAWAVACSSVILGLLASTRVLGFKPSKPWLVDLHRHMGGLTFAFIALHLVTLWADSFVTFGWAELFVPFASTWRAGAVAWGILSMYLLAAIELSSLIKDRLPQKWWMGIHLSSYLVVITGTIHAWQAGSDVRNPFILIAGLVLLGAIVSLTVLRVVILRSGTNERAVDRRKAMLEEARVGGRRATDPPAESASLADRWSEAKADAHR